MGLNHEAVFARIHELVASDRAVSACMGEIITLCARDIPHDDWAKLSALDYDGDVASLAGWISGVFQKQPAPFPIQGLWFGLFNPADDDNVWADMYIGAVDTYSPEDEELGWLSDGEIYHTDKAYAHSAALRGIYEIAYGDEDGLENDAEWPLCLAFAAFAARSLLRGKSNQLVGSSVPRIGVAIGFDSGDTLKIGELTAKGFTT